MKERLDKLLKPDIFATFYLTFLAINMVAVINPLFITRIFLAFFAVWGFAIAAKTYLTNKQAWCQKLMPILLGFLGVCFVTEFINFKYGGFTKIIQLCYFAICIVLLYAQYENRTEDYMKLLKNSSALLGFAIFLTLVASNLMFVLIYRGTVVNSAGKEIYIGFHENRLFGVYSSPNVGGMFALINIWCALVTLYLRKGEKNYKFWLIASIIEILTAFTYISLGLSIGTYLAGIAMLIVFLMVRVPFKVELKFGAIKRFLLRLASVFLAIVICALSLQALNAAMCGIMKISFNIQYADGDKDSEWAMDVLENADKGFDGRTEAGRDDIDITNKRLDIWKSHLKLLKGKNLLLGINNSFKYYESELDNGRKFSDHQEFFINWAKDNMHNGYIQTIVNCGIFAAILLLVFLLIFIPKCIIHYFTKFPKEKITEKYLLFSLTVPVAAGIIVNNMNETNFVLMGANFIQAIFWLVAGVCMFCMKKEIKE